MQGTSATHGAALGAAEAAAARKNLAWELPPFEIPDDVKSAWDARERGKKLEADWQKRFADYARKYPELAAEFERRMNASCRRVGREHADAAIAKTAAAAKTMATRKASQAALEAFAPQLPELIGGSADLTGSNNTLHAYSKVQSAAEPGGNYLHYGVREFGMSAMMNGMAAHGGVVPYGGTFLVFSDYSRNALRMACLIGLQSIFVLSHDSIGLGEDGPTHQPIEHLGQLAADAADAALAAVRHGRDRGRVARGDRAARRPDEPDPHAPGFAARRRARRIRSPRSRAAATFCRTATASPRSR